MAQVNDLTTASGYAKTVFGKLKNARPDKVIYQNKFKWSTRKKLGRKFEEYINMTDEGGVTYDIGTAGSAYVLNESIAATGALASGQGSEMTLRAQVSLKALSVATSEGEQAFGNFYGQFMRNAQNGMAKRVDLSLMFGGDHVGAVASVTGSGTTRAITLTPATWIPGAWLASRAAIDVHDAGDSMAKLNTNADVVITSVNPFTRTLNVSGNSVDLTAVASAAADGRIFFKGAYGQEAVGLRHIAGLTTGESYLGINVNDYPDLWAGNTVAVGGAMTFDKLQTGLMGAAARGGEGDHILFVSPKTWGNLADDMSALRVIDSGYKDKVKYGHTGVEFITSTGRVEIMPTLFMMEGEAVAVPKGKFVRRGSTDITFTLPSIGDSYFRILDDKNGVELRCYSDQFLWGTDVKSCIHFTGIVNS